MAQQIRIASTSEVPSGTGKEIAAAGRIIALYNVDGRFFALDGICPHAGGPLGAGQLCGTMVTCPWHGWQFDVATGRHGLNPSLVHTRFPVTVQGEDVFVELPG